MSNRIEVAVPLLHTPAVRVWVDGPEVYAAYSAPGTDVYAFMSADPMRCRVEQRGANECALWIGRAQIAFRATPEQIAAIRALIDGARAPAPQATIQVAA
jgi:hypothetical protein